MRRLFEEDRRLFLFLIAGNFLLNFGHRVWSAMFNNFAIDEVGVGPAALGWIQSAREVPGLLAILLAFLALVLSEFRIMALSLVLMGLGIVLTGQAVSMPVLLAVTVLMSVGFHFFEPCSSSVVLMSIERDESPKVLGQLRSLGALATIVGTGAVLLLVNWIGFRGTFAAVGGVVMTGGAVLFVYGRDSHKLPRTRRVKLRRRYWLYYILAFLTGSRRHMLTTFAPILLVLEYGVSVNTMAILFLVNALLNTYGYQKIGKLIARFGERAMFTVAFALLIPIFLGYGYVRSLTVAFVLFVLDTLLFGINFGLTTYLQKIAVTTEELTSNLSAQTTINHISAVVIPALGGTLWVFPGVEATFLIGVGIAVLSLVFTQFIRVPRTAPGEAG